jgi:hypothetical protein
VLSNLIVELMARPRPNLPEWNNESLRPMKGATPQVWVSAVLSSLTLEKRDIGQSRLVRPGRLGRWYSARTFGEVREAIRRELERRGSTPSQASALASLRTARGLKDLEAAGAVVRRNGSYRLREEWVWGELSRDAVTKCQRGIRERRHFLRARVRRRKSGGGHWVEFTVSRRGKPGTRLEIAWAI